VADVAGSPLNLTDTQLAVLTALCRPLAAGDSAAPATDEEIADALLTNLDAVRAQLRTLYRRFEIDDLPRNQKRARLAQLALEGGYVSLPEPPAPAPPRPMTVAEQARAARGPGADSGRSIGPYVTAVVLILVVIGGTLSISGIFNSSPTAPKLPTAAAYRAEVARDCKLALAGAPATDGEDRAERARGYLEVFEMLRGNLETLVQPAVPNVALERFSSGLANATNYTSDVADAQPGAGSQAEAKVVAELSAAARQVHAGAVGYQLGPECLAIGDLVAR
jgi:hypothetical protein